MADAGTALNQQFGFPNWVGGAAVVAVTLITLYFGFGRLVEIVGSIGPVVSILAIPLGVAAGMMNPSVLTTLADEVPALVENETLMRVETNWFMACASYVGFCMMFLAVYMTNIGKAANSKKEACFGAVLEVLLYSLASFIINAWSSCKFIGNSRKSNTYINHCQQNNFCFSGNFHHYRFHRNLHNSRPLLWVLVQRFALNEKSMRSVYYYLFWVYPVFS